MSSIQCIISAKRSAWGTVCPFAIRGTIDCKPAEYDLWIGFAHISGLPLTMLWKASCLK